MSLILEKLCKNILLEHCGPVVQEVGNEMFKHGPRTLGQIKVSTKLLLSQVLNYILAIKLLFQSLILIRINS